MKEVIALLFVIFIVYIATRVFKLFVRPAILDMDTKEIERNPKWIVDKVKGVYYGFHDIDFILAESNIFSSLPRFKISKTDRYELWLPSDISIRDVDEIVRLALVGKIQVKYGLIFRDKSLNWLSILCYMLDGGDIREDKVAFEDTKKLEQETS